MADVGGDEPHQPGKKQGKGEEGEGVVGLSHDSLVFAMLEKFSGNLSQNKRLPEKQNSGLKNCLLAVTRFR